MLTYLKNRWANFQLRNYFIAGLLILVPLWATLLVLGWLVGIFDNITLLLPKKYQLDTLIGFHIPGLTFIISLIVVLITGILVTNFFGKKFVIYWEAFLARIPLVNSIYSAVKQIMETFFSSSKSFRKAYLVEFPKKNIWTIGLLAGDTFEEAEKHFEEKMLTLYIPTTPIPTSGYLVVVPESSVRELSMPIDQALKLIVSLGTVQPEKEITKKIPV
jgi:uncharacterized membrane protein